MAWVWNCPMKAGHENIHVWNELSWRLWTKTYRWFCIDFVSTPSNQASCKSQHYVMPYYGLFSRDLHILDLQWRSPLCSLWILPLCALHLCSMTHYDITVAHDIATNASIVAQQWIMMLLGTSIVMPQWIMALLCVHNMASQLIMTLLGTSFAMYYYAKLWYCCFTSKHF